MALTVKKKKLTLKSASEEQEGEAAAPAAPPQPELAAPARGGGIWDTVFAILALVAVLLFAGLVFFQWKELGSLQALFPGAAMMTLGPSDLSRR